MVYAQNSNLHDQFGPQQLEDAARRGRNRHHHHHHSSHRGHNRHKTVVKKTCPERVKKFVNNRMIIYKEIFGDVFSLNAILLAFRGLCHFWYCIRRQGAPLSKRVNWRLLALEPLCCIDSMHIRGGCASAAVFQIIAIAAMTSSSILKILTGVTKNSRYDNQQRVQDDNFLEDQSQIRQLTFTDIVDHPVAYGLLLFFNVIWAFSVFSLMLGVRNFDANVMRPHIAVQVFSVVVCFLVGLAQVIRFSTVHDWGSVEELAILLSCIFAVSVQIWSITVVYECMKYFKMCEVIIDMSGRGAAQAHTEIAVVSIARAAVMPSLPGVQ